MTKMIVEVHEDGRVVIDGRLVAKTNNPREVLRRLKASGGEGLVLQGRALFSWWQPVMAAAARLDKIAPAMAADP